MKTKEFIAKLREEAGEDCHVRWEGDPVSAEISTQGPFAYKDEDGKMHFTMEGYRLVIKSKNSSDVIRKDLPEWYAEQKRSASILDDKQMLHDHLMSRFVFEGNTGRYAESINKEFEIWLNEQA